MYRQNIVIFAATFVVAMLLITILRIPVTAMAGADTQAGKVVYDKKCKICHAAAGEGNPKMAKVMKAEFKHLGSKEVQDKKDDDMKKAIVDGVGKMKAIKELSAADVDNVIGYVRTLKK
ncbi:MAG TPA: cytochrome c [Acidobacteriota bacterium]|jgi:mono/diheme cytochrome c family protein